VISKNEFLFIIESDKVVQSQRKKDLVELPIELERQIFKIYDGIDKDGNGSLDKEELKEALKQMNFDLMEIDFDGYFDKFDVDKDGVVTREEFKAVILDWLKMDFESADEFNESIRAEFRRATEGQTFNRVTHGQLKNIFNKLNLQISDQEFDQLFEEMTKDLKPNNSVDIDTLMSALLMKNDSISPIAQTTIINMRQGSKV
jgi:Ca2+-binding EF-hand superfamily protein